MANQPNETGGLIFIHAHNNFDLLEKLTVVDGKLYYDGKPVMVPIKDDKANALIITPEGELFVDGTYFLSKEQYDVLSKFDYSAYLLTFNGKQVSMEATDVSIKKLVDEVWANIDNDVNYNWLDVNQEEVTT